jgi:hypothetical protein
MNEEQSKALSINPERSKISLENNASDKAAVTLQALLGTVPVVGSILQEAVGVVIPNQRMDRVILTMKCFAQKVAYIEEEVLRQKMRSEEFTDLLEDAIPQAARSLSEERRENIASFLKNSLTSEELDHVHEKKLLSILGELNDAEIIFLRYESLRPHEKEEFFEQHQVILKPIPAASNSPRSEHDKNALRSSFKEKLFELGLLQRRFVKPQPGKTPDMDEKTGMLKAQYFDLTQLGRALLRYIDQPSSSDKAYDEFLAQKQKIAES